MYTQLDQQNINRRWQRFGLKMAGLGVVLAACWVVSCLARWAWLGYASAVILGGVGVLLWSMEGVRCRHYSRFLRDLAQSTQRDLEGRITGISGPVHLQNEMTFMMLTVAQEGSEDRQVYVDTQKWPLPLQEGDQVHLKTSGNIVVKAEVI